MKDHEAPPARTSELGLTAPAPAPEAVTATVTASAASTAPSTASPTPAVPVAAADGGTGRTCPECGEPVPADARFVVWCAACGWNADPEGPEPVKGRWQARRKQSADRQGERLHAELTAHVGAGVEAPSLGAAGIAAYALAWSVHLVTVAVTVTGILLLVLGPAVVPERALGVVLLLVAAVIRPRFGRLPRRATTLERPAAPHLFAFLDRVASAAGTRTADVVVVDGDVNASVTEYGIRRKRLLHLGLPLWHMLTPQQRVAVLGHEFGHYANGDSRRGLVVGTALDTLAEWYALLRPAAQLRRSTLESIARAVMYVPRGIVLAVLWLLDRCTLQTARRAEYRADAVAARIASTEAHVRALDATLAADSVAQELRRQGILARTRNRGADPRAIADGLWAHLAAHGRSVPEYERERLRRVSAARGHHAGATHPPTHLRRDLLEKAPREPGTLRLDDAEAAAIDAELAVLEPKLAKETLRDLHL